MTKRLNRARFDLYSIGTRQSPIRFMVDEISYWSDLDENVIGLVARDRTDDDYSWILLARDRIGRFRSVKLEVSIPSLRRAEALLRLQIAEVSQTVDLTELGIQGDETNSPTDLLTVAIGTDLKKLHPYFSALLNESARAPARAVVKEIGPWLALSDPHFVGEFQQHQFDQRLWELYLWASFRELGFDVEQLQAPDFKCSAPGASFTVEATTAAPSATGPLAAHPNPKSLDEINAFLTGYMPIKFGSSLTSKLNKVDKNGKHYWEHDNSAGVPFMLAIADFHKQTNDGEIATMTYTQSALWLYLYGHRIDLDTSDGEPAVRATPISEHTFGEKTIKSGFFDLPGAENISAVLFSNAGTLAKFDRMGVVAGFGAPDCNYIRIGTRYNPDPNATEGIPFSVDVSSPEYEEYWSDELQIFHNPNAKIPVPTDWFGGITQHYFENGQLFSIRSEDSVLSSYTVLMRRHGGLQDNR